ncbi:MAG: hypothetical protein IJS61_02100 [Firmicutes bacterium]|nr:hypothetical protein [Bacillota bacterium]
MKDFFKEQLVKKEKTDKDAKRRGFIVAVAVAIAVFLWEPIQYAAGQNEKLAPAFITLAAILLGLIIFFAVKKIKELNVEYEYCYTDGILDIDIIKNKAKRKQVFSGNVEEFEIMAPIDEKQRMSLYSSLPLQDFSSAVKKENTYVFVATYKGKKKRYVIEPQEDILKAMRVDLAGRFITANI